MKLKKTVMLKAKLIFANLKEKRPNYDGTKERYGVVVKVPKNTKEHKALQTAFMDFVKEGGFDKKKVDELKDWFIYDGDTHKYWSQEGRNENSIVLNPKTDYRPKTYKKNSLGNAWIETEDYDLFTQGSDVFVAISFLNGERKLKSGVKQSYQAFYLNEVYLEEAAELNSSVSEELTKDVTGLSKEVKTSEVSSTAEEPSAGVPF